jgi:hypothetical protein
MAVAVVVAVAAAVSVEMPIAVVVAVAVAVVEGIRNLIWTLLLVLVSNLRFFDVVGMLGDTRRSAAFVMLLLWVRFMGCCVG